MMKKILLSVMALFLCGIYQGCYALVVTFVNNTPYNFYGFAFTPCNVTNDFSRSLSENPLFPGNSATFSSDSMSCWGSAGLALTSDENGSYTAYPYHTFDLGNHYVKDASNSSYAMMNFQDNQTYYLSLDAAGDILASTTPPAVAVSIGSFTLINNTGKDYSYVGIECGQSPSNPPSTSSATRKSNNTISVSFQSCNASTYVWLGSTSDDSLALQDGKGGFVTIENGKSYPISLTSSGNPVISTAVSPIAISPAAAPAVAVSTSTLTPAMQPAQVPTPVQVASAPVVTPAITPATPALAPVQPTQASVVVITAPTQAQIEAREQAVAIAEVKAAQNAVNAIDQQLALVANANKTMQAANAKTKKATQATLAQAQKNLKAAMDNASVKIKLAEAKINSLTVQSDKNLKTAQVALDVAQTRVDSLTKSADAADKKSADMAKALAQIALPSMMKKAAAADASAAAKIAHASLSVAIENLNKAKSDYDTKNGLAQSARDNAQANTNVLNRVKSAYKLKK